MMRSERGEARALLETYEIIDVVPEVIEVHAHRFRPSAVSRWKGWFRLALGVVAGLAFLLTAVFAATFFLIVALVITAVFGLVSLFLDPRRRRNG